MNKRQKKKHVLMKKKREQREQKILRQFTRLIKKLAKEMTFDCLVKPHPNYEQNMMLPLLNHTEKDDMPVKLEIIKSRNLTGEVDPVMRVPEEWQHNSAVYNPYE